jgi:hypothetical protein
VWMGGHLLERIFNKQGVRIRTVLISTSANGGNKTSGFIKDENSWLAKRLLTSHESLCSLELVVNFHSASVSLPMRLTFM